MSYFSGHPHSTYTQKSPKLDPLPSRTQSYHLTPPPFYPLCVRTFYIFTPPPVPHPTLLLINFYSNSSFRHSQFPGQKSISKRLSIHSLRLVYTFLYTIINGNVITTFVQQKKSFEILRPKKIFFAYVCNLVFYLTIKNAQDCSNIVFPH